MNPLFYSDFARPGLVIPSSQQANANPVLLAELQVFDVIIGERLKIEGFAQVDAVSDLIGTNVQIAYTDSNGPNFSGRWALPSIHFWGTGNVWRTKGEHHKAHRPVGHYIASQDHAMVTFTLFANIYSTSPTPLYATINDCGMTIERYAPDA